MLEVLIIHGFSTFFQISQKYIKNKVKSRFKIGVQPTFRKFCTLSKFQSKKADILDGFDFFYMDFYLLLIFLPCFEEGET